MSKPNALWLKLGEALAHSRVQEYEYTKVVPGRSLDGNMACAIILKKMDAYAYGRYCLVWCGSSRIYATILMHENRIVATVMTFVWRTLTQQGPITKHPSALVSWYLSS